jgi:hypothetical protein
VAFVSEATMVFQQIIVAFYFYWLKYYHKVKKVLFLKVLFFLSVISCSQEKIIPQVDFEIPEGSTYFLDVKDEVGFEWPDNLVVDDIIYLQTTDNSIISKVRKLIISPDQNKFYIADWSQEKLLVFDEKGQFISRLNNKGFGPGEYSEIRDFHIDFKKETIQILGYRKIHTYSLNEFEFIKTESLEGIKGDINYTHFVNLDEVYYLWTNIPDNQRTDLIEITKFNLYHLIRKDGDEIEYLIPYEYGVYGDERFYQTNKIGEYNLSPILGQNSLIGIKKDGIHLKHSFPFLKNVPPKNVLKNFVGQEFEFIYSDYYKTLTNFRETDNHIFFQFIGKNGKIIHVLFDSTLKKIISIGRSKDTFPRMSASNSKHFYGYFLPIELEKGLENGKTYEHHPLLKGLDLGKIDKDDNPILIKFHLP